MHPPSRDPGIFEWVWLAATWCVLLFYIFIQIRYYWRRIEGRKWPRVEACIQDGTVGDVSLGRGASNVGAFFDYNFELDGIRHFGSFVILCGTRERAEEIVPKLKHLNLPVRYDPKDPDTSLLVDYYDLRFGGEVAIQNPECMNQAPTPALILKD
jgi:hypothetical protein